MLKYLYEQHHAVMDAIDDGKKLSVDLQKQLEDAIREFAEKDGV